MRRPVIAGNWKMYKTQAETRTFFEAFKPLVANADALRHHRRAAVHGAHRSRRSGTRQRHRHRRAELHWEPEGAFTGEVSARMLVEAGCRGVIIGHSERRQYFGETDESVNRKVKAALEAGLTPIVCVGETLAEREANHTHGVLKRQFEGGLAALTGAEFSRILIAYEPVWAIGTGRTATPEMAADAHRFIRELAAPASRRNGLPRFGSSTVAASNPTTYGD